MPCVPSRLCHVRDLRRSRALRPGTGSHQTRPRWHLTGLAASRAESSTALCLRATRCSGSLGRHMRPPHGHIQGYKEIPAGPHCVPQISPFTGRQVPSAAPWTGLSLRPLGCGVGAPSQGPGSGGLHSPLQSAAILGSFRVSGRSRLRKRRDEGKEDIFYPSLPPLHPSRACYSQIRIRHLVW